MYKQKIQSDTIIHQSNFYIDTFGLSILINNFQ